MRKHIISLILLAFLLGMPAFARADLVKLKNDQIYKGTITADEEDRIQIKLEGSGVRVWFQKDQIASMEKSPQEKSESEKEDEATADSSDETDTEGLSDDVVRARALLKKLRQESDASGKAKQPTYNVIDSTPAAPESSVQSSASTSEIEELIEQYRNGKFYDRLNACKKLGALGAVEAIPHLIHYLDDENFMIRDESNKSLKKITGRDFGFDPKDRRNVRLWAIDKWKKWYEEYKKKDSESSLKSLW